VIRLAAGALLLGACSTRAEDAPMTLPPPGADAGLGAANDGGRGMSHGPGLRAEAIPLDPSYVECWASGTIDCSLATCATLGSCCIGDGACGTPVTAEVIDALPIGDCALGDDAADCFTGRGLATAAFGTPPIVTAGGISAAEGAVDEDGGIVLGSIDLATHSARVELAFHPATECALGCVDAIGVAIYRDAASTAPLVALVYSAQRARVGLFVGGVEVQSHELGAPSDTWALHVLAPGTVRVDRNGAAGVPVAVVLPRRAVLAIAGRAAGTSSGRAAIASIATEVLLTDNPSAWDAPAPLLLNEGATEWSDALEAPSIASDGSGTSIAFSSAGSIYLARATGAGVLSVASDALIGENDLGDRAWARGGRSDPELVIGETGPEIYFAARDGESEQTSIGHARIEGERALVDAEPVLHPAALDAYGLEAPTVAIHPAGDRVMIARVRWDPARAELLAFVQRSGGVFMPVGGNLGALTASAGRARLAFAADELGDPTLVLHDRVWKLFVGGRRGTRWTVGLFVSDDLEHWRWYGEVFGGARGSNDRLGVRSADVAPTATGLEMIYEGAVAGEPSLSRAALIASDDARRLF
jgi:hypothetical protein